jgi:Peroxisomal biogenesis factor 11 (PEX11)
VLPKLKALFMASYFAFDHAVWLGSVGIIKDKKALERCAARGAELSCWLG